MNADWLLAHYERIADAPEAISRLRRFTLDLAVRGKLVEQNLNDEPASELLKRVAAEKARLVKTKRIKKLEVDPIGEKVAPFSVPSLWQWTRLGTVGDWGAGSTPSRGNPDLYGGGLTWLKSGELNDNTQLRGSGETVTELAVQKGSFRINCPGDVLIAMYGATIGKLAILAEKAVTNQAVCGCTPFEGVFNKYLFLFLLSQREGFYATSEGGAQPNISKAKIVGWPISLPPLAEQHRIVSKVDELMALCDRLEAARMEREATRDQLAAASLVRLNDPDPDPVVFQNHAAFALENLAPLTTRTDQIKALRQTILNLAVRGKLVEQDPNDEPAAELLKRIAVEKVERKRKTGDARVKMGFDPKPDDGPMVFPPGWAAQSFENLFLFIDYRGKTPPKTNQGIPLITAKNIRMGYLNREPREYISEKTFKTWMTRGFPKIEDLFFTTEAPLANICLNEMDQPFALAQRVICFQPYGKINTKFLMFALMSAVMQSLIDTHATGMTAKGIKAANLKPLPIPIPPLAEQHRIVAKVDELMVFCNRLEKKLAAGDDTRRRLLDALLHEVLVMGADRKSVA